MRFSTATTVLALASYALAASTPQLPACAQLCFLKAVSGTSCGITDYYCQCTKGSAAIAKAAGTCLCANVGASGGCSASDLANVQKVTNEICSSALAASSQTYTATTNGANYCATIGGSGSGSSTTTGGTAGATSMSGSMTSGTSGTTTGTAAAASSMSASSSTGAAAMPTKMAHGLEAALGLAGLVVAAL